MAQIQITLVIVISIILFFDGLSLFYLRRIAKIAGSSMTLRLFALAMATSVVQLLAFVFLMPYAAMITLSAEVLMPILLFLGFYKLYRVLRRRVVV